MKQRRRAQNSSRARRSCAAAWLRPTSLLGALVLALQLGCDPEPEPSEGDGTSDSEDDSGTTGEILDPFACEELAKEAAVVRLGSGSTQFLELTGEPAPLKVIQGPQGGFHVWASLRSHMLHPGAKPGEINQPPPQTRFVLTLNSGTEVGDTGVLSRPLRQRSDGQIEMVGEVVPLFIANLDEVVWQEGIFSVEITDACGRVASEQRWVTLEP